MQLSFYGAAGEVTGSNYLLETSKSTIVIDCGAFQGGKDQELKNIAPFLYDPTRVDAMVLTHAHLDHVGRVAKLVKDGFRGHIWCTPPTRDLAELIMLDSAKIMSHEELKFGDQPMYDERDVTAALEQFKLVEYNTRIEIAEGVEIRLVDAGHILGAASVELWADGKKILFSGDIGNPGAPIIRDPVTVSEADFVVCESTYGNREHEAPEDRQAILKRVIDESVMQQGVLLIPSFALERTQELLHEISHLVQEDSIPDLPFFLDSPLAIKTTNVFGKYPEFYDAEAADHVAGGEDFFDIQGLKFTHTVAESKSINSTPPPKVIIAGSGMVTGGRIIHHLNQYIDDPQATILFVGYQAQGTLGQRILDGVKHVDLFRKRRAVKLTVESAGSFSAHADHSELLKWLGAVKNPSEVYLTHGDPKASEALKQSVEERLRYKAHVPRFGEHVEL